jgi:uncharacterized membrane protein SpoIIM required for sporulation
MNLPRFKEQRRADWERLSELIQLAHGRADRLSGAQLRELGARYRSVIADLARVRQQDRLDPLVERLEGLGVQGHHLVYSGERRRRSLRRFLTDGYWETVAARPAALVAAVAALVVPAVLAAIWAQVDPAVAVGVVPEDFASVLDPSAAGTDLGLSVGDQAAFSAYLLIHNVQVSLVAFALGILFCVGTVWVLAQNGLILGAIGGLLAGSGNSSFFVELVAAHGVLELSGVVVAGAAGFRMGWALVSPGRRERREALVQETRQAALMVLGTIPVFAIAASIEGFVSRSGFGQIPMLALGLVTGGAYWVLVVTRGRRGGVTPEPAA